MLLDVVAQGPVTRLWIMVVGGAVAFVVLVVLLARQLLSLRRGGRR